MTRVAANQTPFEALLTAQALRGDGRKFELRPVDTTGMDTVELALVGVGNLDVWAA